MYRTDKQFMKNPATAPSRIYIGNIPKAIVADDLEAKFAKYGKVLGLVVNSGFAFIQYEYEFEAQKAIASENATNMMGRTIIVRQAFPPKEGGMGGGGGMGPQMKGPPPRQGGGFPRGPPSQLDKDKGGMNREPENRSGGLKFDPPRDNPMDTPSEEVDSGPPIRPPPQQKFEEDRGRRGGRGRGGGGRARNRSRDRFDNAPPRDFRERESFIDRSGFFEGPQHAASEALPPPPDRNDCEIIVVSRALTEYAEFIESRLKHLGLVVDLLFPNEDVPIGKVLANISSRGCLYAILIMPQNEEHRSLTLNILHSIPQEHRNMPIEDAFLLLQRNFEAYMRGEKAPEDPVKMSLSDRHPTAIQMLFNMLAENRMMTSTQYEHVIKYLQERKDLQREHEIAEGISPDSNGPPDKQNELQSRIMNILNKTGSNDSVIPTSITSVVVETSPVQQDAPTPLLKDPSVQKALDSILSGDMFKGMAGGL